MLASLLPGGNSDDPSAEGRASASDLFEHVEPSPQLQHALLAIVNAEPRAGPEAVRAGASVVGFVHVADVDDQRRRLRLLAPLGGRLPRSVLVWGSWPEDVGEMVG